MLVTDHAGNLPEVAEGRIEHGRDAEGAEVAVGELARASVVFGVMRGDGALFLQGPEVRRIVLRLQLET